MIDQKKCVMDYFEPITEIDKNEIFSRPTRDFLPETVPRPSRGSQVTVWETKYAVGEEE